MKSPTVLLRSLRNDTRRLEPYVKGLDRDFRTIEHRVENEGYGFLTIALPAFCQALERGLADGKFSCPFGFRKSKGSSLPRFLSGLTSEVFDSITGLVKEDHSDNALVSIEQICYFFKKVALDAANKDKLHAEAVDGFFRNDELIDQTILSDRQSHLLGVVCNYVLPELNRQEFSSQPGFSDQQLRELLVPEDFRLPGFGENISCKHGPGAVAERFKPNQKWVSVFDGIISDAFDTSIDAYDMFGINADTSLSDVSAALHDGNVVLFDATSATPVSRSTARLISVAKNSSSRRTITIEPVLKQFVQQGLKSLLWDSVSKCKIMSNCLTVTDQSPNQKLALEGSLRRNWSTIDLKSASDLLSLRLVRQVFSHFPEFLSRMEGCRSDKVELDGVERTISKYAGMGNATTFPVQSIVFALLAITAIVDDSAMKPSYWSVKRASRRVRVYGDDIVVDTRHVHTVVSWLTSAGLIINTNKSFLDGNFKESCGVRCYKGVDLTPLYIKHRPDDASTDPNALQGLIDLSNSLWLRGYYETSNCIAQEVEERLRINLPLVSSRSGALGWTCRQETMDFHSWNPRLHRVETNTLVLKSLKRRDELDGYPALLKFFHVPLLGRPKKHLHETSVRFKLKIAKKRVPAYAGAKSFQ